MARVMMRVYIAAINEDSARLLFNPLVPAGLQLYWLYGVAIRASNITIYCIQYSSHIDRTSNKKCNLSKTTHTMSLQTNSGLIIVIFFRNFTVLKRAFGVTVIGIAEIYIQTTDWESSFHQGAVLFCCCFLIYKKMLSYQQKNANCKIIRFHGCLTFIMFITIHNKTVSILKRAPGAVPT